MATRFWVGGTGNWDAVTTTNWAATTGGAGGASVPTSADTVTFDGASGGGTVTVTANTANVQSITMGAFTGTFNANGFTINTAGTFSGSGTGTRTITLGSSTINCVGWSFFTTTNLTFNANTSSIISTVTGNDNCHTGGLTYNNFSYLGTATNKSFTGASTFANLTIDTGGTANSASRFYVNLANNITVTGVLTLTGGGFGRRLNVYSSVIGTARTITSASNTFQYVNFKNITGAGAGSWNLSAITGLSGDCGGNSGITFSTAVPQYWYKNTGNWSDTTKWFTSTGGVGAGRIPLPQDNVIFDGTAFDTASQTVTSDIPATCANLTFTGATNTPTIATSAGYFFVTGNITFISAMVCSAGMTFFGTGTQTLNTNSMSLTGRIVVYNGATVTFNDAVTSSEYLTIDAGTLNFGTFTHQFAGIFGNQVSQAHTWNFNSCTLNITGTLGFGIGAGDTINAGTSTIKMTNSSNTAITFALQGKTYYNFWLARGASTGSNTISGSNTFTEFKDTGTAAHSILFTTGTTQTVGAFTVSGTAGNLITINSTTTGTHALVKSGGGQVSCDYLNIQHSVATPSSTWYAGTHSTDNQAVATAGSGWIFTAPPSTRRVFIIT